MMEDFSGLALPPLFGEHILEAELETAGVELLEADGVQAEDEQRELDKRKYHALSKRCKELEQVNERILGRLHQVQRLTRRLRKERRFLLKTLDSYGDDYSSAQIAITLQEEGQIGGDGGEDEEDEDGSSSTLPHQTAAGTKKRKHRLPKDRERVAQTEAEDPGSTEAPFPGFPSPRSH